jgi:SulP family sulfate permease
LAVGPEAMTSVLLSAAIQEASDVKLDPASIAAFITLMVGILLVVLAIFQAGYLENIIGGYILTGFVLNVSVLIMIEQIPGLLGYHITHSDKTATFSTFQTAQSVFHKIDSTHWNTFWVSISCIAYLLLNKLIKKLFGHKSAIIKKFPGVLTLLIIATSLSYFLDFNSSGIEIFGNFDNQLAPPKSPPFNLDLLSKLISIIVTISIVGFIESQTPT